MADGVCEIETSAGRVRASARRPIANGAAVVVAVRPERVALEATGEGLGGVVTDVIFVGTARKYAVRLSDGTECFALRQVGTASMARVGTAVRLSWGRRARHRVRGLNGKAAEFDGPLRVWMARSPYTNRLKN